MTHDDPCSVEDGGFSLFDTARPAKKKSTSGRKIKGKAGAIGNADGDANSNATAAAVIEAAPSQTPTASRGLAKVSEDASDDKDGDAPVTFKSLGLSDWLCRICSSLGITRPTPVQSACIPAALAGRDVLGVAQTGSGKTAAFALPLLQRLARDPYGIHSLVLTPTRELAFQIGDSFAALGSGPRPARVCVVVGGLDARPQAARLAQERPHVVVATPGRLADLIETHSEVSEAFSRVSALVLDEADRLLDGAAGFEGPLTAICSALPKRRQSMLFSATMSSSLVEMQGAVMQDAFVFTAYEGLRTADRLLEQYALVPAKVKDVYTVYILQGVGSESGSGREKNTTATSSAILPPSLFSKPSSSSSSTATAPDPPRSALVFCATTQGCAFLARLLAHLSIPATALHSALPQRERLSALDAFRGGRVPLLLATDVASRGLDLPTVDLVLNYDVPADPADYVHRVGRTARAGRAGMSLTLVTQHDVSRLQRVEAALGKSGSDKEGGERTSSQHRQLSDAALDERDVLKWITRVYSARKAAALEAADEAARGDARGKARLGSGGGEKKKEKRRRKQ